MIFSPHGDGYCKECHFVVGLEEDGLLEVHYRGASLKAYVREPCPGSDTRPGRRQPKESRNAAFTTKGTRNTCGVCFRKVTVRPAGPQSTYPYLAPHTTALHTSDMCGGSYLELKK